MFGRNIFTAKLLDAIIRIPCDHLDDEQNGPTALTTRQRGGSSRLTRAATTPDAPAIGFPYLHTEPVMPTKSEQTELGGSTTGGVKVSVYAHREESARSGVAQAAVGQEQYLTGGSNRSEAGNVIG